MLESSLVTYVQSRHSTCCTVTQAYVFLWGDVLMGSPPPRVSELNGAFGITATFRDWQQKDILAPIRLSAKPGLKRKSGSERKGSTEI